MHAAERVELRVLFGPLSMEEELTPDTVLDPKSSGCLDDYEVVKPIGKGKFSVVYRAKRNRDGLLVAMKVDPCKFTL